MPPPSSFPATTRRRSHSTANRSSLTATIPPRTSVSPPRCNCSADLEEARKEAEIALQLNPKFTIRLYRAGAPSDNPVYLKQRERIIEALRAAGIPEG